MKTSCLIVLFTLVAKASLSQSISIYSYKLNQNLCNDENKPYYGMEQEFVTERTYFSASIFSENRIFTGDKDKKLTFRVDGKTWYYKSAKGYEVFYDYNKKVGGVISQHGLKYQVRFRKTVNVRGMLLDELVLEPVHIQQSHKLHYYFIPTKGVLIIRTSSGTLLRSDAFKKELSEEELDNL